MALFASEGSGQPGWALTGSPDATPASQRSFLASLLTTGPVTPPAVPQPDTLLTALANHAWINTPGVSTAADSPLQQRGLLPEGQSAPGAPAPAATELRAATGYLAARPGIDIDAVLGGAMDIVSHRLDAWATGLAVARLAAVRARPATGPTMVIGGYGIVENLVMSGPFHSAGLAGDPAVVVDPSNDGYLTAPGLAQAVTAAVLRGGYLNHAPAAAADRGSGAGSAPFAVDLSSRRARTAQWLLDGMRKGQPLGALLGYRFERRLIKDGLGTQVTQFRQVAPLDRAANQDPNVDVTAQPAPPISARGTDVADGVTLHAIWQAQQAATKAAGATTNSFTEPATQPAFLELDDALDAVTDAITATAVHQALNGDTSAAAASLDSVMHGTVTADPSGFLRTSRTGTAIIQRVLLPVSAAPLPAGWADTPRGQAEPALSAWVATLLPAAVEHGRAVRGLHVCLRREPATAGAGHPRPAQHRAAGLPHPRATPERAAAAGCVPRPVPARPASRRGRTASRARVRIRPVRVRARHRRIPVQRACHRQARRRARPHQPAIRYRRCCSGRS